MKILAFESSCDETAVAVVEDGRRVLSDAIASQADMHALYGGVVPEIASRKHVEAIAALTDKALADAEGKVIFGGRLGMYKYFDMDDTIAAALALAAREL